MFVYAVIIPKGKCNQEVAHRVTTVHVEASKERCRAVAPAED